MTSELHPAPKAIRQIVERACRAPSFHNTQPWSWRTRAGVLELHADRSRQLPSADPLGRNLVISCGAALHHAQVTAAALGWDAIVSRLPDGPGSTLLASIELRRARTVADATELLRAIEERRTDRRRFTSWPVPEERLQQLAAVAEDWGVRAVPVFDVSDRFTVERLVAQAIDHQVEHARVRREQAAWIDHGPDDGVPSTVIPAGTGRVSRFGVGLLKESGREIEGSDGVIILFSARDDPETWVRAGEALSAMWLKATSQGLSVVPLSQVVEVAQTRDALQHDVLGGLARPLVLVRIGWQPISRSELPATARRPIEDVLDARGPWTEMDREVRSR